MRTGTLLALVSVILLIGIGWNWSRIWRILQEINAYLAHRERIALLDLDTPFAGVTIETEQPQLSFDDFLGAEACASCHVEEYSAWANSPHGRAGSRKIVGAAPNIFTGKSLRCKDGSFLPTVMADSTHWIILKFRSSEELRFRVDAVIGGGSRQTNGLLSLWMESADGYWRLLPFAYDLSGKQWLVGRADSVWSPASPKTSLAELSRLEFSPVLGTHLLRQNCQDCHATAILIQPDVVHKKIRTLFRSLRIECEACHGPGRRHVQFMQDTLAAPAAEIGYTAAALLPQEKALRLCERCHAPKEPLRADFLPGMPFEKYFSQDLPVFLQYFRDVARPMPQAHQRHSFLRTCMQNSPLVCSDCHEAHAGSFHWRGASGDSAGPETSCRACHPSKIIAGNDHAHHRPDSAGSRCLACHMPPRAPGGIMLHAAQQHLSLSGPDAAERQSANPRMACERCHKKMPAPELEEKYRQWFGEPQAISSGAPGFPPDLTGDRKLAAGRLLLPYAAETPAKIAGLALFQKNYLQPQMGRLSPEIINRLKNLCLDADPDVAAIACMSLHVSLGRHPEILQFLQRRLKRAGAGATGILLRWAAAADALGEYYFSKGLFPQALLAFRKALEARPQSGRLFLNLGEVYFALRDYRRAAAAYQMAIEMVPWMLPAYEGLASTLTASNKRSRALAIYEQATQNMPYAASLYLKWATACLKQKDPAAARSVLQRGLQYLPDNQKLLQLLARISEPD